MAHFRGRAAFGAFVVTISAFVITFGATLATSPATVKEVVMLEGLRAKFGQHPDLAERLLRSGDRLLVEHTRNDSYWGDGGDGSGKNRLGHLLMQVRAEIRRAADDKRDSN